MRRLCGLIILRLCICSSLGWVGVGSVPAFAKHDATGFAACLVKADPSRMRSWVDFDGPGLIYKEIDQARSSSGCRFDGTFEYWAFRGLLAEQLVAPVVASGVIPDFSKIDTPTDVLMAQRWGNNDGRISMLLNVYAECETKNDTTAVFALLKSPQESDDERKQSAALIAKNDACREMSDGVALRQPAPMVRARLSLAIYRFLNLAQNSKGNGGI